MKTMKIYMVKVITSHEDDGLGCRVFTFDTAKKCVEYFKQRVEEIKKSIAYDFSERGIDIDFADAATYDDHFYYYEDEDSFDYSNYSYQDEIVVVKDLEEMKLTEEKTIWNFGKEEK